MKEPWAILFQYVLPPVLGFIAGVVGSLFGPLVQWAVEKRRNLFSYRRELIRAWREDIENFDHDGENIRNTATYSAIRPHLKREVRERLESPRTVIVEQDSRSGVDGLTASGKSSSSVKTLLLVEVARIEQKWGLV